MQWNVSMIFRPSHNLIFLKTVSFFLVYLWLVLLTFRNFHSYFGKSIKLRFRQYKNEIRFIQFVKKV